VFPKSFPEIGTIITCRLLLRKHTNLLEQTIEINVNHITSVIIEQNVLAMPVSQPTEGTHA
jgi:hypothetical protein